ncbi:MAG: hypothetical protein ACOYEO_08710 [bacterium]|jgi:hypothetical protein
MSIGSNIFVVGVTVLILIIGIQALLVTRKQRVLGYLMPAAFLYLAGYNLYKLLYVYNPYPTMAEGIYVTFGLIGFGISTVTLVVCRIIERHSR